MSKDVIRSQPSIEQIVPIFSEESSALKESTVSAGLGCLRDVDQLIVKQRQDHREIASYIYKNTYIISDGKGIKLFTAKEESNCFMRNYCGRWRPFDMTVSHLSGFRALDLYRPPRCQRCCFPCCLQKMQVYGSDSCELGSIVQNWNPLICKYQVQNHKGEMVLTISGDICQFALFKELEYEIYSMDGSKVGRIFKPQTGILTNAFTNPYLFRITFLVDLEPNLKALILGAYFLIDYMYHQSEGCSDLCCCCCW